MSKNQYQQYPTFHFFLSVFAPWRFKKNVQMPFKLSSQNVSIVSGMRIKNLVIPFSQLWSEAGLHHKGHEEREES